MSRANLKLPSWQFSASRSATIASLLDMSLAPLIEYGAGGTIVRASDEAILIVRSAHPTDISTLPQSALACLRYLQLKPGELAILNDPSSGGTTLGHFTLCTAISGGADAGVMLIAARVHADTIWSEAKKLDDEGVRIPPTPLGRIDQPNVDLIRAISLHPLAPVGTEALIEETRARLANSAARLQRLFASAQTTTLSKTAISTFLSDTSAAFEHQMARLPLGTSQASVRIPGGNELIKLNLEITEQRVHFDFKGTESSLRAGLTELATLSACTWAVLAFLETDLPVNSGLFEHFAVSAPAGTCLASKAPLGTVRGVDLVAPTIGELVLTALRKINPKLAKPAGTGSLSRLYLDFGSGKRVTIAARPGARAQQQVSGANSWAVWSPNETDPRSFLSVEEIERRAPVRVTSRGVQGGSGGKGITSGGDGELVCVQVLSDAKLLWNLGRQALKSDGHASGKPGQAAHASIVRAGATDPEELTGFEGVVQLKAGDEVRFHGAGGGGWGAPSDDGE